MAGTDYYKTLGVSRDASADDIRKAYKKLVRKYHPDVKPDDKDAAEKFKAVQEAMDVLGDENKKAQYDRFGTTFPGGGFPGGGGRPQGWGPGGPQAGGGGPIDLGELFGGQFDLGDILGGAFGQGGGAGRTRRSRKGSDVEVEIEIPFQIAVEGGNHEVVLDRGGKAERLTVKIPPGVDTGSVIRLAGQGQPGAGGGAAGDLLVTIRVAPHPWFRREGTSLLVDVPLSITEASLGAKVDVPTLTEGKVTLTVPAGTSSGAKLRLKGKGVLDRTSGQRGDQFVVIKIVVPKNLSARAREQLQQLADELPQSVRADLW